VGGLPRRHRVAQQGGQRRHRRPPVSNNVNMHHPSPPTSTPLREFTVF
jgi:hypothetical protein